MSLGEVRAGAISCWVAGGGTATSIGTGRPSGAVLTVSAPVLRVVALLTAPPRWAMAAASAVGVVGTVVEPVELATVPVSVVVGCGPMGRVPADTAGTSSVRSPLSGETPGVFGTT